MSRKSRDQRGEFRTIVRYDGRGRIIPGGNILKKGQKPQEGNWQAKEAYECCNPPADCSLNTYVENDYICDYFV